MLAVGNGVYTSCMHAFSFGAAFLFFFFQEAYIGVLS